MHGKINGVLNNVNLNDVDIQAYVVVGEGRAYTALSLVPGGLGSSLQQLNVLGGVIGWLFAQPANPARNGYQLTGSLFNHSADVWFPASGDRVVINQEYLGHDVFDQITLETDIRGSVPVIMPGSKLEISDYDEQYTLVEPGLIRSSSSRTFTNKQTGEKIEQRVSQTFTFNACRFAPPSAIDSKPLTLKVVRNYLGFETRENIVRYGMTSKIFPLGQEDPCIEGRSTCSPHSTCVVQGESFACVCQSGFTSIYQENVLACIDIDECAAGTHNCDHNADCYNHAGGFQCRCRQGFTGNGINCYPLSGCYNKKCDSNAQCVENPGRGAACVCNSGFYGDGQFCLPVDNNPPPSNEAEYNESIVLPHCDVYGCSCPSGYSDYTDNLNNQLCLVNSFTAPPQQTVQAGYQERTDPPYHPPTESYRQPETERPYPPSTQSFLQSPEPTYPSNWDNNYQQNNYDSNENPSNYEQNNYNQNPDPNPPPNNYDQNLDNNYQQNGYNPNTDNNYEQNNYDPKNENNYQQNNYDQNADNNYQQNNNDQNVGNSYPQNSYDPNSEPNFPNNYDQYSGSNEYPHESNNEQASDNNYQTSERTSTPPPNNQESWSSYSPPENNYDQQSENNYQETYDTNSEQTPATGYRPSLPKTFSSSEDQATEDAMSK